MRIAPQIELTDVERETLRRWSRGRATPARLVLRAKIVLAAADGSLNRDIAFELGTSRKTVGLWRERFAADRLKGHEKDAPRGGRTPAVRARFEAEILRKTTQETPSNATHWSTRSMARAVGCKQSLVSRIWRDNGLKPHRVKTFKVSNDPQFAEKLVDVVGLYLNPPDHALVLSVDEKSQKPAVVPRPPGDDDTRLQTTRDHHDVRRVERHRRHADRAVPTTAPSPVMDQVSGNDQCGDCSRVRSAPDRRQLRDAQTSESTAVAAAASAIPQIGRASCRERV